MKLKVFFILITGFSLLVVSILFGTTNTDWKLEKTDKGVSLYTKTIEGTDYKEVKGTIKIHSDLARIYSKLMNIPEYPNWAFQCKEAKVIKEQENQLYVYTIIDTPWPAKDRDAVLHFFHHIDTIKGTLNIKINDAKNFIPEKDEYERIKEFRSSWEVIKSATGEADITYTIFIDPGGNLPSGIVNAKALEHPFETLVALKKSLETRNLKQSTKASL